MIEYTITIAIDKRIPLAVLSPAVGPKFVYPERIAGFNGTHSLWNRNWYSP